MTPLLTGRLCQSFVPGNPHCADSTSVRKTNLKICHPVHSIAAAIRCHMLYCIDLEAPQARVLSRKQAKHRVTSAEAITSCCSQAAVKKTNRNLNLHHETADCTINHPHRHKHAAKAQKPAQCHSLLPKIQSPQHKLSGLALILIHKQKTSLQAKLHQTHSDLASHNQTP